jgi:LPXTG-motif cell wall-anchored protein
MTRNLRITALTAALWAITSAPAVAQTSELTTSKQTQKSGVIQAVYGNHVVVQEASGTHEYTVPDGFKFQMNGQDVTVADLQPGMKVSATINEQTTTRDVTTTKVVSGQVVQVAPGGIVVKDSKGQLKSYGSKDVQGRDVTIVRNGKEIPLSDLKLGDKLNATIVTTYPPQVVTKRSVTANLTPAPQPATSSPPTAVASAEPATLPKTGSPLPLLGLLGGIALATALLLRGIDRRRRAG